MENTKEYLENMLNYYDNACDYYSAFGYQTEYIEALEQWSKYNKMLKEYNKGEKNND